MNGEEEEGCVWRKPQWRLIYRKGRKICDVVDVFGEGATQGF
jgi:hypothetical protein